MRGCRIAALAIVGVLLFVAAAVTLGRGDGSAELVLDAVSATEGLSTERPATDVTVSSIAPDQLRVEAVHKRTEPPEPAPVYDIPVVTRPAVTTTAPADPNGSVSSPILTPPPSTPVPSSTEPAPIPCPSAVVRVTVTTAKSTYSPGETVQGSSTLENRGSVACLLPTRAFFRVVNSAGKDVSSFAYTMEFRYPVRAEPGKTFSSSFTWDQRDCSGPACAQVPAGPYTVVADWSESGPYVGRSTFQVVP